MKLSKDMEQFHDLLLVALDKAIQNDELEEAFSVLMGHIVRLAQTMHANDPRNKAPIERVFKGALQDALEDLPEPTLDS